MFHKILSYLLTAAFLAAVPLNKAQAQSCDSLLSGIQKGQNWIVSAQLPSGLFTYEYLIKEATFTENDNIVRQMGTFWALIETLDFSRNEEAVKAVETFRKKISSMVLYGKAGDEDIAYIEFNKYGKVNTTALYILSLMSLKERGFEWTEKEKKDIPLIINGIRKMSDDKGGFWYIYYLPEEYNMISTYGSGEVIYALAKFYDDTNDIDGLAWTYNEFTKYYNRYLKSEEDFYATEARAFFSWSIYGLAVINKKYPIKYYESVAPLLRLGFKKREQNQNCKDKGCLLGDNLGDAPFMEGMVHAYKLALIYEKDEAEIKKLKHYLDLGLKLFSSLQITDMEKFRKEYNYEGKEKYVLGAFCNNQGCEKVRNDLTQHALSAFMYYYKEFCGPAPEQKTSS